MSGGWSITTGNQGTITDEIVLRDAKQVVSQIVQDNPECNFILKMNIEGSEYEVFDSLAETDLLSKINSVVVHCHFKGPYIITDILERFGFQYVLKGTSKFCIIYAFRG